MLRSSTIIEERADAMMMRPEGGWDMQRITTHPGEMLREEFMVPLELSVEQVAEKTRIDVDRLRGLVEEQLGLDAEIALRLARFLGTTPEFWMNVQQDHELTKARMQSREAIEREIQPLRPAIAA